MERLAIALVAITVIVSGCVDALQGEEPEEEIEEEPEPVEPENETTEDETTDEETDVEETEDSETEENGTDEEETTDEEANGEETEETEADNDVDRTVNIEGGPGTSYNVSEVDVEEGETVEFVYHHAGGTHDLNLEKDGEDVESTSVLSDSGATESFTYTFEEDDSYEYYCSVGGHRAQGMEGTVKVE